MRLVVSSMILSLAFGAAGCAAATGEPPQASEEAPSLEIKEKAVDVVKRIEGLMTLNHMWIERMRPGAATPAANEPKDVVKEMKAALSALPSDAEWVIAEVKKNEAGIAAGFAAALASDKVEKQVGKDKVKALRDAVEHHGGIVAILLKSAATVHDHSGEMSDRLSRGEKMSMDFFCAMAGTVAGANAAREQWAGMLGPIAAMHAVGGLR